MAEHQAIPSGSKPSRMAKALSFMFWLSLGVAGGFGLASYSAASEISELQRLTPSTERLLEMMIYGCLDRYDDRESVYCMDHYPELANDYIHGSAQTRAILLRDECFNPELRDANNRTLDVICSKTSLGDTGLTHKAISQLRAVEKVSDGRIAQLRLVSLATKYGAIVFGVLTLILGAWLWLLRFLAGDPLSAATADHDGGR